MNAKEMLTLQPGQKLWVLCTSPRTGAMAYHPATFIRLTPLKQLALCKTGHVAQDYYWPEQLSLTWGKDDA